MPQTLAPFHLQSEIRNTNTTAKAGAVLPLQMLHATGVLEAADSIGLRPTRGFEDRDHVTATALLNLLGLGSCDDMKYLRDDVVLGYLCRETGEHHGVKPRTDQAFPSPSASRSWLHDVGDSPAALAVVKGLPNKPVDYIQERKPQREVTLDMDATFIPTKQGDAPVNYQGERSNEAFNVYCPELDMIIYSEYTSGNVSPRRDPLGLLEQGLEKLPQGVETVSLRVDSAGYNMDLLRYCCEGRSPWGVIHFGISVPMYPPCREAVQKLPEDAWQRLDGTTEWAEVNIVPSRFGYSKKDPQLRFLALRQKVETPTTAEKGEALQKTLELEIEEMEEAYPKVKSLHLTTFNGGIYKTFLMVTNKFEEPGEQVIRWQRGRCGKSEEVHSILKNGLAGGHVPTGDFGANAAWWYLSVLSFNLQRLMTHHLLPAGWARVHQKRLLATIYSSPARLIRHAGQIVLKIYGKAGKILEEAHWRLLRLHMMLE
jgi:hypothetical protein